MTKKPLTAGEREEFHFMMRWTNYGDACEGNWGINRLHSLGRRLLAQVEAQEARIAALEAQNVRAPSQGVGVAQSETTGGVLATRACPMCGSTKPHLTTDCEKVLEKPEGDD